MQGISTSPATGSHTSPSWLLMAMAQASAHCPGEPPISSARAAAAMAEALPHSAWQPPSAPAMVARWAITMPKAPAVKRLITAASRVHLPSASRDATVPGNIPQEPAVGAATMRPMAALFSLTASARAMERPTKPPQMPPPAA